MSLQPVLGAVTAFLFLFSGSSPAVGESSFSGSSGSRMMISADDGGEPLPTVETVSGLKAFENPEDQLIVEVEGYWEPGDGGGGVFAFASGEVQESDGGMIVASDVTETGRWMREWDGESVDIRWYGARSDVEEDQAGYILAAIDYFFSREQPGTVFIPEGTFHIARQLGFWEGVSIKGEGMETSVIKNTTHRNYTRNSLFAHTHHYSENRTLDMELSHLKIDVNMYDVGEWIGAIWIEEHFRNLVIDHVHMTNSGGNIIRLAKNSRISNSIFDNMDGRGLSTGWENRPDLRFRDNEIINNTFIRTAGSPTGPGINLSRAENNVFRGNEVINENPPGDSYGGIRLPNDSRGNLIEDNYVRNFPRGIWLLSGSQDNEVRGNTVVDSWIAGLFINSSHEQHVPTSGNILADNVVRQENPRIGRTTDLIRIHEDFEETIVDNVISGNEVAVSEQYMQAYRQHAESQFQGNSSLEEGLVWLTNGAHLEGRNEVRDNFVTIITTPEPEETVQAVFKVDMAGSGVDYEDGVYITGHLNGWEIARMEHLRDEIYRYEISLFPGEEGAYYYMTTDSWDNYEDYRETVPAECADWWDSDRGYVIPDEDVAFAFRWGSCRYIGEETSAGNPDGIPDRVELHQNYPNPFNPVTQIQFGLQEPAHVRITVYSALGQKVAVLTDGYRPAGAHHVTFDGSRLSSGLYLYEMATNGISKTRTMTLIK
ncbi:glycosyl hydrolase family 28-related protein [Balneolales bacterium ANBcel1]|nr:glycosyl hydrolase family 28-related protein [Balneolales bacterium ANBcel1]